MLGVYDYLCCVYTHPIMCVTLLYMIMCGFRTTKLRRCCLLSVDGDIGIRLGLYIYHSWVAKVFAYPLKQARQETCVAELVITILLLWR